MMVGALIITMVTAVMVQAYEESQLIDLSYTYNLDPPASHQVKVLQEDMNRVYIGIEMMDQCGSEFVGTHMEAPIHRANRSWPVDQIPLYYLWDRPALVINASHFLAMHPRDYLVQASDMDDWEIFFGKKIPDGAVVFVYTGQGDKSADINQYLEVDENDINHYKGMSEAFAQWLLDYKTSHHYKQGIVGVGIDTPSLDGGNSTDHPATTLLHSNNIYVLNNVANLDKIPSGKIFRVTVMPMKIENGQGAPVRIIARLEEEVQENRRTSSRRSKCDKKRIIDDDHDDDDDDDHDDDGEDSDDDRFRQWWNDRTGHHGGEPQFDPSHFGVMMSADSSSTPATNVFLMLMTSFAVMYRAFA